jgi:nicotinamidase-related amidase
LLLTILAPGITDAPTARVLDVVRAREMMVIHTREGHSPDLADCPPTKIVRGRGEKRISE